MSESSLSEALPTHAPPADTVLEKALCDVVRAVYDSGNSDNLTVKRVRKAAEERLDLEEDFFKGSTWKDRSKRVIEQAFVSLPLQIAYILLISIIQVGLSYKSRF